MASEIRFGRRRRRVGPTDHFIAEHLNSFALLGWTDADVGGRIRSTRTDLHLARAVFHPPSKPSKHVHASVNTPKKEALELLGFYSYTS